MASNQHPIWEPTPEEIQAGCLEIQGEWTPAERSRRSNRKRLPDAIKSVRLGLTYRFAEVAEPKE